MAGDGSERPTKPAMARAMSSSIDFDLVPFRWAGAAMLALGAALPHLPGNPGVPCPLRTLTGVPCPLCGMTTSVKAAMGGHLGAASERQPLRCAGRPGGRRVAPAPRRPPPETVLPSSLSSPLWHRGCCSCIVSICSEGDGVRELRRKQTNDKPVGGGPAEDADRGLTSASGAYRASPMETMRRRMHL